MQLVLKCIVWLPSMQAVTNLGECQRTFAGTNTNKPPQMFAFKRDTVGGDKEIFKTKHEAPPQNCFADVPSRPWAHL